MHYKRQSDKTFALIYSQQIIKDGGLGGRVNIPPPTLDGGTCPNRERRKRNLFGICASLLSRKREECVVVVFVQRWGSHLDWACVCLVCETLPECLT